MDRLRTILGGVVRGARNVTLRARGLSRRGKGLPAGLGIDGLLNDAVRLAELPSPTDKEERRAAFVLSRLAALACPASVDGEGNITARIPSEAPTDQRPLLLFADMGTSRWHPQDSLVRVDPETARGAGLSDSVGAAALLFVAERAMAGELLSRRNLLFLFAARALDDPGPEVFARLASSPRERPSAAIGVRGLFLGDLNVQASGSYRLSVRISLPETEGSGRGPSAVAVAAAIVQRLEGVRWDPGWTTACRVRRVSAGRGFGRFPVEGTVDLEIESTESELLELTMKAVTATVATIGEELKAELAISVEGHVPVGDPAIAAPLQELVRRCAKELRVRLRERSGPDPAANLTVRGIPAVSVGLALGREGLDADELRIDSLGVGARLLGALVERAGDEK